MQAKVSLPLSAVLNLLNPPPEVETVDQYRDFISLTLQNCDESPAKPGRPLKARHSHYTDGEMKAIKAYLDREIAANQHWFTNETGRARGLGDQSGLDESSIALDNGQICFFAGRIPFVNGEACPKFPPSIG
ncbi:MAG TPA: hypothetical protein VN081_03810 [Dongiaceae bacterium]|nr:hypothetical protein [Dongiaceae bacterium]